MTKTKNMVAPAVGLLVGLQILVVLVVIFAVTLGSSNMRSNAIDANVSHMVAHTRTTESHLTQSFDLLRLHLLGLPVQQFAAALEGEAGGITVLPGAESEKAVAQSRLLAALGEVQSKLGFIRSLSLVNDNGEILLSTRSANAGTAIDFRPFVPVNAHGIANVLLFSPAWIGRDFADGHPATRYTDSSQADESTFFPVAMLRSAHPRLSVVAAINSDYFINYNQGGDIVPGLQFAVYLDDGALLFASSPEEGEESFPSSPGLPLSERQALQEVRADRDASLLTYHASPSYPWYVQAQVSSEFVLADWREAAAKLWLTAGLAVSLMLFLTGFMSWRVYRLLLEQDELFKNTAQLTSVFTHSSDGIVITDSDMLIVAVNPAYETITGHSKDEVLGIKPYGLVSSLQDSRFLDRLRTSLKQQKTWRGELTERRKDGSPMVLRLTVSEVLHPLDHSQRLYVGVFTDVTLQREHERQIRRLSQVVEQSPSSIVITDLNGTFEYANAECLRSTGYELEELLGQNANRLASGLTPRATYQQLWACLKKGKAWRGEFYNRRKNGELYIERALIAPMTDSAGETSSYFGIKYDITREKEYENRLRLAASVIASTVEGVMICDADTRIVDVNPAFTTITGYTHAEVLGRTPEFLSGADFDPAEYAGIYATLNRQGYWQGEFHNITKDGDHYVAFNNMSILRDDEGNITHYVNVFDDISDLKRQQKQLELLAHFDPLTGLANRALLQDRLQVEVARARRDGSSLAVCFMDLDRFKEVNDTHGHEAGDELLKVVARRLEKCVREGDTVARLGGDEFVILLTGLEAGNGYKAIASRILVSVERPIQLKGHVVGVSGSMGITVYPDDASDEGLLMRHADQAMYQAKQEGRNRFVVYDPSKDEASQLLLNDQQEVVAAIESNAFFLCYQPLLDLKLRQIVGFETLLRWRHPERGVLKPGQFLPRATEAGVIKCIDLWVMQRAFQQITEWHQNKVAVGKLNINISASSIADKQFILDLDALLLDYPQLPRGNIEFEVLESSAIDSLSDAHEVLTAIRRMGFRVALDDFGTGFSSLALLRHLPINTLKIDKSFVRNMFINRNDLSLVESVIRLARAFRLDIVAEGVETLAHGEALLSMGCPVVQGYSISRPIEADAVAAWLDDFKQRSDFFPVPFNGDTSPEASIAAVSLQHRLWVNEIEEWLDTAPQERPAPPDLDEESCVFASWLSWAGHDPDLLRQEIFERIRSLHHGIHECGKRVVTSAQQGDEQRALREMEELYALQARFLYKLNALHLPEAEFP